jgi:hypothetical protein
MFSLPRRARSSVPRVGLPRAVFRSPGGNQKGLIFLKEVYKNVRFRVIPARNRPRSPDCSFARGMQFFSTLSPVYPEQTFRAVSTMLTEHDRTRKTEEVWNEAECVVRVSGNVGGVDSASSSHWIRYEVYRARMVGNDSIGGLCDYFVQRERWYWYGHDCSKCQTGRSHHEYNGERD